MSALKKHAVVHEPSGLMAKRRVLNAKKLSMTKPQRQMTGLWARLNDDQRKAALEFTGDEHFGDPDFHLKK